MAGVDADGLINIKLSRNIHGSEEGDVKWFILRDPFIPCIIYIN